MRKYQFKVRTTYNRLETWINIKAIEATCHDDTQAQSDARAMLKNVTLAIEVRWNRKGSLQGHYIGE